MASIACLMIFTFSLIISVGFYSGGEGSSDVVLQCGGRKAEAERKGIGC